MFGGTLAQLDPFAMDDTGMWIWAGILLAVSLAASYLIAILWQRWRDKRE